MSTILEWPFRSPRNATTVWISRNHTHSILSTRSASLPLTSRRLDQDGTRTNMSGINLSEHSVWTSDLSVSMGISLQAVELWEDTRWNVKSPSTRRATVVASKFGCSEFQIVVTSDHSSETSPNKQTKTYIYICTYLP